MFIAMAKILGVSKITSRFQITIPNEVRKILKVKAGQTVVFAQENNKILLRSAV